MVQPRVAGFDDPASRAILSLNSSPRVRMCGVSPRDGEVMHVVAVMAAIQAETLCGYFSLGAGRSIGIESMVGSRSFEPWRLAPSCAHPAETPAASQNRTLRPLGFIWNGPTRARSGEPTPPGLDTYASNGVVMTGQRAGGGGRALS